MSVGNVCNISRWLKALSDYKSATALFSAHCTSGGLSTCASFCNASPTFRASSTAGGHQNREQVFDMKVGNSLYLVDLARLGRGAKHTMPVDYTDTYQEYKFHVLGSDGNGANLVVTSDDCCDYMCITITEVDGKFDVHREPRVRCRSVDQFSEKYSAPVAKRQCNAISSWTFWIGLSIF